MNQELRNYIQSARAVGDTDESIHGKLTAAGWNGEEVTRALRGEESVPTHGVEMFGDERGFHAFGFTFPYGITGLLCLGIALVFPAASIILDIDFVDFDELLVLIYSVVLSALVVGLLIVTTVLFHCMHVSRPIFSKSFFIVGATSVPAVLILVFEEWFGYTDYSQVSMLFPVILMFAKYTTLFKFLTNKSVVHAVVLSVAVLIVTGALLYCMFRFILEVL